MNQEGALVQQVQEQPVDENEFMRLRQEKLSSLKSAGLDPFQVTQFERTHQAQEVHENFESLEGEPVVIAGRLTAKREHGKACFADLRDESGRIQIYAKVDDIGEERFAALLDLDIGDFIGVRGTVFRTRRGEVSVSLTELQLLSKSLRPLPEKWHGLRDVELRYRQRYVDLIVNPEVRDVFVKRSLAIRAIRKHLDERGFLEVETPMLQPIPGGAVARPFVTHHNALDMNLYLRIAPELYLKRLIVGGFEKVYEINRNFRNEGVSTRHNPEFTMIEVYWAYVNYESIMELTEELVAGAATHALGTTAIEWDGQTIDLQPPWRRVPLYGVIEELSGVDFASIHGDEEARDAARSAGVKVRDDDDFAKVVDETLKKHVVPRVMQPTFLVDYPVELSPLAKRKPEEPRLTERFQAVVRGLELANAFSELNDPIDQRERFIAQQQKRAGGDDEAHPMDEDFICALEYGMPPTGGLGIGIDRLVMVLTNAESIRDVILFPQMRSES